MILHIFCGLNKLSREHIMHSHINLNKFGSRGKISLMQKNVIGGTTNMYSCPNIYTIVDNARSRSTEKMSSMSFIDYSNKYISNISNIYNLNVNMSLASKTKCDNMFLDTELDNIFSHSSVTYLVYTFFLLVCGYYTRTSKMVRCTNLL